MSPQSDCDTAQPPAPRQQGPVTKVALAPCGVFYLKRGREGQRNLEHRPRTCPNPGVTQHPGVCPQGINLPPRGVQDGALTGRAPPARTEPYSSAPGPKLRWLSPGVPLLCGRGGSGSVWGVEGVGAVLPEVPAAPRSAVKRRLRQGGLRGRAATLCSASRSRGVDGDPG